MKLLRRRFPAAVCLLIAWPALPAAESVSEPEIAAAIRFLTSPELEGRAAAERGGAIASAYIASRLEAEGWLPAGDDTPAGRSFFQSIPAVEASYDPADSWLETSGGPTGAERIAGTASLGFRVIADRAEAIEAAGPLVFAGFGIRAPEYGHDDYGGLEVRGAVVLVFSGEPEETSAASRWNGARPTRHALTRAKARLAESLGAAALLVVPNPAGRARTARDLAGPPSAEMSRPWLGIAGSVPAIPVLFLEPEAAEQVLRGTGIDLRSASADLEAGKVASRPVAGRSVRLRVGVTGRREATLRNVVARLGSRPGRGGDAIVIGAHWDHLGSTGGVTYPGADDNASGVAGLLAVASALEAKPPREGREIFVAFWTGEERGRLGSTWFVGHPPVPVDRIATAINLDVLGRSNQDRRDYANVLQVIYSAGAPALRDIARAANRAVGFDLRFYGSLRFQPISDHYTFFEAGIPIVYPFAGYIGDYHEPGDTPDKLDVRRIARSAVFVARLARLLAERPGPIRLDPSIREAPPPDPFDRPD